MKALLPRLALATGLLSFASFASATLVYGDDVLTINDNSQSSVSNFEQSTTHVRAGGALAELNLHDQSRATLAAGGRIDTVNGLGNSEFTLHGGELGIATITDCTSQFAMHAGALNTLILDGCGQASLYGFDSLETLEIRGSYTMLSLYVDDFVVSETEADENGYFDKFVSGHWIGGQAFALTLNYRGGFGAPLNFITRDVPEPGSLALCLLAFAGLGLARRQGARPV